MAQQNQKNRQLQHLLGREGSIEPTAPLKQRNRQLQHLLGEIDPHILSLVVDA